MNDKVNEYAEAVHRQNCERGWWDDPLRCSFQALQLVITEIAEATEGDRKDAWDDHLPERKAAEVELADAFIRLLDLAGRHGWTYREPRRQGHDGVPGALFGSARNLATAHLAIVAMVAELAEALYTASVSAARTRYRTVVFYVFKLAEREGYDLWGAVDEKLAYNKTRADHDRTARAAFHGKRY